jgi:hypothetical protein
MMIWFPRLCSASARPRPIPEPPPVMKIVFPVRIMDYFLPAKTHIRSINSKLALLFNEPFSSI